MENKNKASNYGEQENLNEDELTKIVEDPMDSPGILKKAIEHGSAQRVYDIPENFPADKVEFCECCNLPTETKGIIEPFPYCVNTKKLSSCGVGAYLYFFFIKYIIFSLLIALCMSAIPTLIISKFYANDLIDYCLRNNNSISFCGRYLPSQNFNQSDWLYQMSYESINKTLWIIKNTTTNNSTYNEDYYVINYSFINFLTCLTLLIVNSLALIILKNMIEEADLMNVTPSDYALMICNVPKFNNLLELNQDILAINDLKPIDVNVAFDLDTYFQTQAAIIENKKKLSELKKSGEKEYVTGCCSKRVETKEEIIQTLKSKRSELNRYMTQINKISENPELFTGVVFASFDDIKEYEEYQSYYPQSLLGVILVYLHYFIANFVLCCCYSNTKKKNLRKQITLRVEKSPEPTDIIWQNLQYSHTYRNISTVIVYIISFILIGISLAIIFGLNYIQFVSQNGSWSNSNLIKYILSIIITGVISIVNFLMTMMLDSLTKYEKVYSMTEYYLSLSLKITIFTFINTAIVPLVSNISNYGWDQKDILLNNLIIIFLSNAFVSPLLYLSNMWYFFRKWKVSRLEKNFPLDKPIPEYTQRELNDIYEYPDMDISYKYSYIAKTFLMSAFYMPLLPVGVIISIIGIALTFFIEKYNFLRTYKRPDMLNQEMCKFFFNYFKLMIFTLSIGNWIFLSDVYYSKMWSQITIIVFGAICALPIKHFFKCYLLGHEESQVVNKKYLDSYFDFATDYERENPITRLKGNMKYLERLREKNYISKEMYEELKNKMSKESVNMIELYYRNNKNLKTKAHANTKTLKYFQPSSVWTGDAGHHGYHSNGIKAFSQFIESGFGGYQSHNQNVNIEVQGGAYGNNGFNNGFNVPVKNDPQNYNLPGYSNNFNNNNFDNNNNINPYPQVDNQGYGYNSQNNQDNLNQGYSNNQGGYSNYPAYDTAFNNSQNANFNVGRNENNS